MPVVRNIRWRWGGSIMNNSLVSVVITTKNEEAHLLNCIKSIRLQTYSNIEIIVVDNFSTDKTKDIAKEYADLFFLKGDERSMQRNYGLLKKSKGEYLLYLDADMILEKNLIEECIKQIQEAKSLMWLQNQASKY
ncbi:MAG: glycosyltransferase [Candidatus Asgardarchaeum sp.]